MNFALKSKLDELYIQFNNTPLFGDPIVYPHRFNKIEDIEFISFVASVFSYGTIKQITNYLEFICRFFGDDPVNRLMCRSLKETTSYFIDSPYRFYTGKEIVNLFSLMKIIYAKYGGLESFLIKKNSFASTEGKEILNSISKSMLELASESFGADFLTPGFKFMFPSPYSGSPCKRINMFLRWVVRKDNIDFGIWKNIKTSSLIIPVDTHIANISKQLNFTKLKNPSWKMAIEVTDSLKKFEPTDPVKYDFALCHIGIRKIKLS